MCANAPPATKPHRNPRRTACAGARDRQAVLVVRELGSGTDDGRPELHGPFRQQDFDGLVAERTDRRNHSCIGNKDGLLCCKGPAATSCPFVRPLKK